MTDDELQKAINDSGFPLQLGLKHLAQVRGKWTVALSEHPWHDPLTGDSKFLDLGVLAASHFMLVVECKRSKETDWIFIRDPSINSGDDTRVGTRAFVTALKVDGNVLLNDWAQFAPVPGSPIGDFCVIRKGGQRTQELLERTAAEVVRATEAIAKQDLDLHRQKRARLSRVYFPIIVTTARLLVCDLALQNFDPMVGEIPGADFREFPVIRFAKSFSAPASYGAAVDLDGIAEQSERSVLIVQAGNWMRFLQQWDTGRIDGGIQHMLFGS